jgi:hypothetical protein
MPNPLEVFCCSAREDKELMALLNKYLTPLQKLGQITMWSDINLNEGVEWEKELHQSRSTVMSNTVTIAGSVDCTHLTSLSGPVRGQASDGVLTGWPIERES